jgi:hypothetical protein
MTASPVLAAIEQAKRSDQIAAWTKAENAMADRLTQGFELLAAQGKLSPDALAVELTPVESLLKQRFVEWCAENGVRNCPSRPSTVATFLLDQSLEHEQALAALSAIGKLHDKFGLPNPCATAAVRTVLQTKLPGEQPRWKKHELEFWAALPADIRAVIALRENQRGTEVRRIQSELAKANGELKELRKQINHEERPNEANKPSENIPEPRTAASG